MYQTSFTFRRQRGAANTLLYLALTALIVVGVGMAVYFLSQKDQTEPAIAEAEMGDENPYARNEPPRIKPVDMQNTAIEDVSTAARPGSGKDRTGTGADNLFDRGTKKLPLTDGLAGGSESPDNAGRPVPIMANAVDGFDFGILDGRIRIGVFAKGPVPDYRVSVTPGRYLIEMPGDFRYVEEFSRPLRLERLGVSKAQLLRDERGMRMLITVTPDLQHEPFLIEDGKGLIVAFEPRR